MAATWTARMLRVLPGLEQARSYQRTWLRPDGRLDPDRLLGAFLAFWREHGQPLLGSAPYHEIAPHLVLMAFLHRVVNGHGTIQREYAVGSGRMDLQKAVRSGRSTSRAGAHLKESQWAG